MRRHVQANRRANLTRALCLTLALALVPTSLSAAEGEGDEDDAAAEGEGEGEDTAAGDEGDGEDPEGDDPERDDELDRGDPLAHDEALWADEDAAVDSSLPLVLEGRVLEAGTRAPLGDVEVIIEEVGLSAITGDDGRFEIRSDAPDAAVGRLKVTVAAYGYLPFEAESPLPRKGSRKAVIYHVRRDPKIPMKTTVRAKKKPETTVRSITREEIDTMPGAFGDPVRAVFNMPGVARAPLGLPLLIVRGSEPGDTLTYVEGHPIPLLFHFGVTKTTVNADLLSDIEFYPGAMPTRYGRAHGGAVELRLRDDIPKRWGGHIQSDPMDSEAFAYSPIGKKVAVFASFRRSYIDALLRVAAGPLLEDLGVTVAPRYLDYSVMVIAKPVPRHSFRAIWFGADDRLVVVDPDDPADETRAATLYHRGLVTWDWRIPGGMRNHLSASFGYTRLRIGIGVLLDARLNSWDMALRDELIVPVSDKLELAVGLDSVASLPDWDIFIDASIFGDDEKGSNLFNLDSTELIADIAVYAEARWKPIDDLRVIPGLRVDWFFLTEDAFIDPRLSARYAVHKMVTVKASAGRYGEPPTTFDTGIGPDRARVAASWSLQETVGVEIRPLKYLIIDLELFHKELYGLEPAGGFSPAMRDKTTGGDEFDATPRNGRGRVLGAELLVRLDPNRDFPVTGFLAYTLSRSTRWNPEFPEIDPEPSNFDQRHIFTAVMQYKPGKGWLMSARWRFVSGRFVETSAPGSYDVDEDGWLPTPTGRDRLPPFHSLDLRAEKTWTFDWWKLTAYLEILNTYNRRNPEGVTYSYDYRRREYLRGLPILPLLGLRATF